MLAITKRCFEKKINNLKIIKTPRHNIIYTIFCRNTNVSAEKKESIPGEDRINKWGWAPYAKRPRKMSRQLLFCEFLEYMQAENIILQSENEEEEELEEDIRTVTPLFTDAAWETAIQNIRDNKPLPDSLFDEFPSP